MQTISYTLEINKPLEEVYNLARHVEQQPQFIPDYLSCRVLERHPDCLLLERSATIRGRIVSWQSWVSFRENEGIYFIHQGGWLDGMHVTWQFVAEGPRQTRMTLTQTFHIGHPLPGIGILMEKWIYAPKLADIGSRIIHSFKRACESFPLTTIS